MLRGERSGFRLALACTLLFGCSGGPPRPACNPRPAPGHLGTICGFQNPEDVEAIANADVLLVSQMRPVLREGVGSLAALTLSETVSGDAVARRVWPPPKDTPLEPLPPKTQSNFWGDASCTAPPDGEKLAPHGITSGPGEGTDTSRVAVVSHQPREAIELFELSGRGSEASLRWRGCIPLPENAAANDIAMTPTGDIVIGNYMPTFSGAWALFYMLAGGLGMNTGDVMTWSPSRGWRHVPGTGARNANGVAVSPDGMKIFYAETGAGRLSVLPREGSPDGSGLLQTPFEGKPDNLSWNGRGQLLTSLHMNSMGFLRCAFGALPCEAGWRLVEIDPSSLVVKTIFDHPGTELGGVASASEWNGRYFLGAVFDDRIGVLEPTR